MQTFSSNVDHANIHYDVYEPTDNNLHCTIQVAHGMAEHKGRYKGMASYFQALGYTVVCSDHRGHGDNVEPEHFGDMGVDGFEATVQDMHQLTLLMKEQYPENRYVLLGHSMGSLLARRYLQQFGNDISALILSGTPSDIPGKSFARILARVICVVRGEAHRSKLLDKLSFGSFNKSFTHRTGFEWLSSNPQEVDAYMADNACGFIFAARSFDTLIKGLQTVYGSYPKPIHNPTCPILFVSGQEDPCGSFQKGVRTAAEHMCQQGFQNVQVHCFPQARHELFHETCKKEVYDYIEAYIKERMPVS